MTTTHDMLVSMVRNVEQVGCPLPVAKFVWDDDGEMEHTVVLRCGETLTLVRTSYDSSFEEGNQEEATWKVKCFQGHTIFMPENGGDDHEPEFTLELLWQALEVLGATSSQPGA